MLLEHSCDAGRRGHWPADDLGPLRVVKRDAEWTTAPYFSIAGPHKETSNEVGVDWSDSRSRAGLGSGAPGSGLRTGLREIRSADSWKTGEPPERNHPREHAHALPPTISHSCVERVLGLARIFATVRPSRNASPSSIQFISRMLSTSELNGNTHHGRHPEHLGVFVVVHRGGLVLLHERHERMKEVAEHPAFGAQVGAICGQAVEQDPLRLELFDDPLDVVEVVVDLDLLRRVVLDPDDPAVDRRLRSMPMLLALRMICGTGSSSENMRLRSPRRAPSIMYCRPITLLPTPEIPATTVVLPSR